MATYRVLRALYRRSKFNTPWLGGSKTAADAVFLLACPSKRHLLTAAYACTDDWNSRLDSPALRGLKASEFMVQLLELYQRQSGASAIDVELFANRIQDVHPSQLSLVESLLSRFHKSEHFLASIESMPHAIVRAYLELGEGERLVGVLQDKLNYGIFPDEYAFCLLMNHFIVAKDFADAAKIAFECMLQEDVLLHSTTRLLAIAACCGRLAQCQAHFDTLAAATPIDPTAVAPGSDKEIEYRVTKYVTNPWYDDHFDITDEKLLLGKTLAAASRLEADAVGRSLQLYGLGLSEKFDKCAALIESWLAAVTTSPQGSEPICLTEMTELLLRSVELAQVKVTDIVREHGMQTLDDERYNARLTEAARSEHRTKLQELCRKLKESGKVQDGVSLTNAVNSLIARNLPDLERQDVTKLRNLLATWKTQREKNVDKQTQQRSLRKREEELNVKLKELHDKEELVTFFARKNEIELAVKKAPREKKVAAVDDSADFVAEPGKRVRQKKK